jgi:hypothetical protein
MKSYQGSNAGSQIEKPLWNAGKSVWIISPWIGANYARRLASMSQKGIEVRIVTSNDDLNMESVEILTASSNPNLMCLVLNKEKAFVHSKIYIVDRQYAFSGSANLTYNGLNRNVERLDIAENTEELRDLETDFIKVWFEFERKSMSNQELADRTSYRIKNALPLNPATNYVETYCPDIQEKELVYRPYYFFEYNFNISFGGYRQFLFKNNGLVVIDGETSQILNDNLLAQEIISHPKEDRFLRTENKYKVTCHEPKIREFEARRLAIDHIQKVNTQYYQSGGYNRVFVPFSNKINLRSDFVNLPIWYIGRREPDGRRHQDIVLAASGRKWGELIYCSKCQKKIWIDQALKCQSCGNLFCPGCIQEVGFVFRKKLCSFCLQRAQSPAPVYSGRRKVKY